MRPWEKRDDDDSRPTAADKSCSNQFVAAPVVARPSSNGLMSLLTRTERSVSFTGPFLLLTFLSPQNYLGHSINAPTGRWQKKKDVHWYNRDLESSQEERAEEIRQIKEAEAEALSVALYALARYSFHLLDSHSHIHI